MMFVSICRFVDHINFHYWLLRRYFTFLNWVIPLVYYFGSSLFYTNIVLIHIWTTFFPSIWFEEKKTLWKIYINSIPNLYRSIKIAAHNETHKKWVLIAFCCKHLIMAFRTNLNIHIHVFQIHYLDDIRQCRRRYLDSVKQNKQ